MKQLLVYFTIFLYIFISCDINNLDETDSTKDTIPLKLNITAKLVDKNFTVPIDSQPLYLVSSDNELETVTDSSGMFSIQDIKAGTYAIYTKYHYQAWYNGYIIDDYYITDTLSHVSTDSTLWRLSCAYLGEVSGTVVVSDENPKSSFVLLLPDSLLVETDVNGNYKIPLKPYVSYKIKVSYPYKAHITQGINTFSVYPSDRISRNIRLYSLYDFYPLNTGDLWFYYSSYSGDMVSYSSYYRREITGDTVFSGIPQTFKVIKTTFVEDSSSRTDFFRIDDDNVCVYTYKDGKELKTLSFSGFSLTTMTILGEKRKVYQRKTTSDYNGDLLIYAYELGMVKKSRYSMYDSNTEELISAIISGKEIK